MSTHQALRSRYDIMIVGAGPTGLTLANLLGAYGVQVLLIERNAATVSEPRAVSIDDESLRTMQAIGLSEAVLERVVAGYGSEYYTGTGRRFLRVEPTAQPYGYPRRNAFRQPTLEAQLREGLARFSNVTPLFCSTLRAFTQSHDRVQATVAGADEAITVIECDYLVGCDGAASTVRAGLDIKLVGKSFQERWLIIDLDNSPAPSRNTLVFCDVTRPCIALPGPNATRRYEFKLHSHETAEQMLQPELVSALLARYGAAPGSTITRKVVYTFHARLAERWSVGRVFLAGDAAHLTPPFAGQGMNSGIRDAHNLAWKLAGVVAGRLGRSVLDTYEVERRDHVRQMIQLAVRMGRIMRPANKLSGWLTQISFRALAVWPRARDYFGEMKYKPQPHFARGFLISEPLVGKRTLVGRLLPQPRVRCAGGSVLLDELLGRGFALLCHATHVEALVEFARHPAWRTLDIRSIAVAPAGASPRRVGNVEVVVDETGLFLSQLTRYRDRVLLVRPDRYVAASFDIADPDHAARSLENLLPTTWPHLQPGTQRQATERLADGSVE